MKGCLWRQKHFFVLSNNENKTTEKYVVLYVWSSVSLKLFAIWLLLTAASSWALTGLLRRYAVKRNLLDIPNKRSSHVVPIPRGGGMAIVVTFLVGVIFLSIERLLTLHVLLGLLGAGVLVSAVGFMDDHGHLSPKWRLLVHFSAAIWALACFGGLPEFSIFDHVVHFGWVEYIIAAVVLVWLLNLFNFMDGIDGIAASEAIFLACSGLFFAALVGHTSLQLVAIILVGSILGFLIWNWPPAKIFMGDVGSGFLGIMLGIYAYWELAAGVVSLWSLMIIFGVFFVDATFTLLRRFIHRKKWYEAHRSHAYQHAAQKWGHLRVTIAVSLINIVWLLPIAYFSNSHRAWGAVLTVLAYLPLLVLVFILRAGKEMKS